MQREGERGEASEVEQQRRQQQRRQQQQQQQPADAPRINTRILVLIKNDEIELLRFDGTF